MHRGGILIDIVMPEISADVTEADVLAWLAEPGDTVVAGDILFEIETDKSTVEIEAPASGVLSEILVPAGAQAVAVGTLLARLEENESSAVGGATAVGEASADSGTPVASDATAENEAPAHDAAGTPSDANSGTDDGGGHSNAPSQTGARPTALARRLADRAGVEVSAIAGSGAHGRVTRDDVEQHLGHAAQPAQPAQPKSRSEAKPKPETTERESAARASGDRVVPHSRMRRTIARRLADAKRTIPHFYLAADCRIDALLEARRQLNATSEGGYKISVNDFVVRACALALEEVPAANVSFEEDAMILHAHADIAVAVATEGGLITPIVRRAETKGLAALSAEIRDLAARARAGRLSPAEYQGGTFSISNLGMYGIDSVYPIVNPPHAAILGVGAGAPQPVVQDGRVEVGTVMTCTLVADHRAVDGAVGAELLAAVKRRLEHPLDMVL